MIYLYLLCGIGASMAADEYAEKNLQDEHPFKRFLFVVLPILIWPMIMVYMFMRNN